MHEVDKAAKRRHLLNQLSLLVEHGEEWSGICRGESDDYRRGRDAGWDQAYTELCEQTEWTVPPLLRRFFWHDGSGETDDQMKHLIATDCGTDEWCNPVFGIRMPGGMLYVRYGRKVRGPRDGLCDECRKELAE